MQSHFTSSIGSVVVGVVGSPPFCAPCGVGVAVSIFSSAIKKSI
jgi:hypothetical protein